MKVALKVYSRDAGLSTLHLTAADIDAAVAEAGARGWRVVSAKGEASWFAWRRGRSFPLTTFVEEALALLEAGLSINEAVDAIAAKSRDSAYGITVARLRAALYDGARFSNAFESAVPEVPAVFLYAVKASESTGELANALKRYLAYAARVDQVRAKAISASVYPLVLFGVGLAVALFLTLYVVPRFAGVYLDLGRELPLATRLLLGVSALFEGHGWLIAALVVGAVGAVAWRWRADAAGHARAVITHLPWIGELLSLQERGRMHRTMAMLLGGGMAFSQALRTALSVLRNGGDASASAARLMAAIDDGQPIASAFATAGLVDEIGQRLLKAGEDAGNIERMFERIADYYDTRAERGIERAMRLIEPLMMLLVGLMIGVVVMVLYLPIFELAGGVQ